MPPPPPPPREPTHTHTHAPNLSNHHRPSHTSSGTQPSLIAFPPQDAEREDILETAHDGMKDTSKGHANHEIGIGMKDTSAPASKFSMSNFNILLIVAILFGLFVVGEIIGALASNSLSLLGDAVAMGIDVFTYIMNMYAEHLKNVYGKLRAQTRKILDIYIPVFSVLALVSVCGWICYDAAIIIHAYHSPHAHTAEEDDVNVVIMYIFASVNFVIDCVSGLLFYVRRETVLLNCPEGQVERNNALDHISELSNMLMPNLNMVSALTHIGGDTLRTFSVFAAAIVSSVGKQDSSVCDAYAAVVVTFTIFLAIMPLCKEIYKAYVYGEYLDDDGDEDVEHRRVLEEDLAV
eukprot:gene35254-42709_t